MGNPKILVVLTSHDEHTKLPGKKTGWYLVSSCASFHPAITGPPRAPSSASPNVAVDN